MDSYAGPASLEWWANRSTCLAGLGVRVEVRVTGDDWTCDAVPEPALSPEERERFDFLMAFDPRFTLRFDAENDLVVTVVAAGDNGRLALTDDPPGAVPRGPSSTEGRYDSATTM